MRLKFKWQCQTKYLWFGYKGFVFCETNGWLMKNMDKGLTVPKWVLINRSKTPQMPQNLSAQIVCWSPKVWNLDEKRLHWASVVRDSNEWLKQSNWQFDKFQMYSIENRYILHTTYLVLLCLVPTFFRVERTLRSMKIE